MPSRFAVEFVAQRLALDVGHDLIKEGVSLARVEQGKDVWVLEVRGGFDLLHEPLGAQDGASPDRNTFTATLRLCLRSSAR